LTSDVQKALWVEKFLIALIGRTDFRTGPLTNKTAGGEGPTILGPETIATMSRVHRELAKTPQRRKQIMKAVRASLTPYAMSKRIRSQREFAKTAKGRQQLNAAREASHTPEALAKLSNTQRELSKTDHGMEERTRCMAIAREASRTPEVLSRIAHTHRELAKTEKRREQLRRAGECANRPEARAKSAANHRKVGPEGAEQIRQRLQEGERALELAREFAVHTQTIYKVRDHRNGY